MRCAISEQVKLLVALGIVAVSSCGDGKDFPPDERFGGAAPPMTDGDWYRPSVGTSWQWQLSGRVNTDYDVDVFDVDLFDTPLPP